MPGVELLLVVCSIVNGAQCKEVTLTFADEGQLQTPYACAFGGMVEIAKWNESHPNWRVARWKCLPAGYYSKT